MVGRWVSDWGMRLGVGGGGEWTYGRERDLDGGGTFFDGHFSFRVGSWLEGVYEVIDSDVVEYR